jgi:hypothetical protein
MTSRIIKLSLLGLVAKNQQSHKILWQMLIHSYYLYNVVKMFFATEPVLAKDTILTGAVALFSRSHLGDLGFLQGARRSKPRVARGDLVSDSSRRNFTLILRRGYTSPIPMEAPTGGEYKVALILLAF